MAKTVKIPDNMSPWEATINGLKYVYPAGTTQEVPDEVAALIERLSNLEPEKEPIAPPFAGGGMGGADWNAAIMVVSFKSHNLETGEIFMSHTASEIGQAVADGKIVFMGMEGATFTTNGQFFQDDETGDFVSIGFSCITMPEVVYMVDAQGRLAPAG